MEEDLNYLSNKLGYTFKSFTIDGRRGVIQLLKRMFPNIPIQMCQFHQKQIIRRYTTDNPQTECGIELKELMTTMKELSYIEFSHKLYLLKKKYDSFLKERNENNRYSHSRLRSAFRSLNTNLPYLFTYKHRKYQSLNIPNTTNTCEGWFAHLKEKVKIHRGLNKKMKEKMILKLVENG
jgi:aspartyl-tRNA synthetase